MPISWSVSWCVTTKTRRAAVAGALEKVCGLPQVVTEDAHAVRRALDWPKADFDFADALHLASQQATAFYSFDRELIDKAGKAQTIPVVAPGPEPDPLPIQAGCSGRWAVWRWHPRLAYRVFVAVYRPGRGSAGVWMRAESSDARGVRPRNRTRVAVRVEPALSVGAARTGRGIVSG